ncbi:MAG: hypothetical protein NC124_18635 [Clostridium sp.]|nr:hypothetical protein [Clostridium sp.]
MFEDFQAQPISIGEIWKDEKKAYLKKRDRKALKQLTKHLKRYNDYQMQIEEGRASELQGNVLGTEKSSGNGSKEKVSSKGKKAFLEKLGEVFLKAIPGILRTITQIIFTAAIGHGFKRKGVTV